MKKTGLIFVAFTIVINASAQQLTDLYKKVNSSVVVIETMSSVSAGGGDKKKVKTEAGQGSGVLISDDGMIWTAAHVVQTAEYVAVKFTDNDVYKAKVLSSSSTADVALIKIEGLELKDKHVAKIGNSDEVMVGEGVFVIGAPHGLEQTLSKGIISGRLSPDKVGESFVSMEFLQTDASINPGNSGGPMFNMKGEVIGIASFILSESGGFDGIGFGASSNIANKILMEQNHFWSGIESVYLNKELAAIFNVPQEAGLLVLTVSSEGLGQKIGLRGGYVNANIEGSDLLIGGDIITEISGIKLDSQMAVVEITKKLSALKKDEKFSITYYREGKFYNKSVTSSN